MRIIHILFVILSITIISCNEPDMVGDKIKSVVEQLASEKVSDVEILNKYFIIESDSVDVYNLNCKILAKLKSTAQNKEIEVLTYQKAKNKYRDLHDIIGESIAVYIVHIKESADNPYMYVLTQGEKIKSITPIVKGTKIIGWM